MSLHTMESMAEYDEKRKGDKKRKGVITPEKKYQRRKEDEIDYWKRKYSDLKERFKILDRVEVRNERLKQKLDDCQHRNSVLYASFKEKEEECRELDLKLSELYDKCYNAERDFNEYTSMFDELCRKIEGFKQKIAELECLVCVKTRSEMHCEMKRLDESESVVIGRGTETEQIAYLEDQAMHRLKYELELENRLEGCSAKYKELCMRYREKKAKAISLENEVEVNKGMCAQLNERIASLETVRKIMCEGEKRAQVRIGYLEKLLGKRMKSYGRETKSQHLGLDEENSTLRCLVGSGDCGERECARRGSRNEFFCKDDGENDICERLGSDRTHEAHVAPSTFEEKTMNNAVKILISAFPDNSNSSSGGNKDAHVSGTVDICDNKDANISSLRICHSGGREGLPQVSTGNIIERCLKTPFSDQKCEAYDSGCEKDDAPLSSTAKRRRYLKIVTSDSEGDDPALLGELQEKVLEELRVIPKLRISPKKLCAWNSSNVSLSSGSPNVEEFVSLSCQRQVSPRKREEKKGQADETLQNVQVKMGNLTSENDEEKVAQEAGSESEADSMGRRFAKGLDSRDSSSYLEDAVDYGLDFGPIIAIMRSNKYKEMKWQNEADMLTSFEKDPVFCMKAVCALHRQTDDERSIKGPFGMFSALSGSDLGEFLMDGNPDCDLKKSVKEMQIFDPEGLEDCKTLATHYSKQLFSIYQNGEDPFFNPSFLLRLTA